MNAVDPGSVVHGDERTRKPQLITCGCGANWTALGAAHCAAPGCHRLFASASLFDLHRSQDGEHGTCLDPETVVGREGQRRLWFRAGMWRGPAMSAEERERVRPSAPVLTSPAAVGGPEGAPEIDDTGAGSSEARSEAAAVSP